MRCEVLINYCNEVNCGNKEWLNTNVRHTIIRTGLNGESYNIEANLTPAQCEHIIAMIQDNKPNLKEDINFILGVFNEQNNHSSTLPLDENLLND